MTSTPASCKRCGQDLGTDGQALDLGFCSGTCARLGVDADARVEQWSESEYFSAHKYLSRSKLHKLHDSVAAFVHGGDIPRHDFRGTQVRGMALGTVCHLALYERGEYARRVLPWSSKVGKHVLGVWEALRHLHGWPLDDLPESVRPLVELARAGTKPPPPAKGKIIAENEAAVAALFELAKTKDLLLLLPADINLVESILAAVERNPKAVSYLNGDATVRGEACTEVYSEVAITWTDVTTGIKCRARLDRVLVYPSFVVVVDAKTCRHTPSPDRWGDQVVWDMYNEQAEFYCRGAREVWGKPALFVWVAIRNDDGFVCSTSRADAVMLSMAKAFNDTLLQRLAKLRATGEEIDKWATIMTTATPTGRGMAAMKNRLAEALSTTEEICGPR